jgi:DNA polymerase III epsilon subunit-like protein
MIYTVLDTEINGFQNSFVLEFYAVKFKIDDDKDPINIKEFHRYYYAMEKYNPYAARVHGLTHSKITEYRKNCKYPEYFRDDYEVNEFLSDSDYIIGHNISFDLSFIDRSCLKPDVKIICTMKTNNKVIRRGRGYKSPKLMELAEHYNIYHYEENFHGAKYDSQITMEVFITMLKQNKLFC